MIRGRSHSAHGSPNRPRGAFRVKPRSPAGAVPAVSFPGVLRLSLLLCGLVLAFGLPSVAAQERAGAARRADLVEDALDRGEYQDAVARLQRWAGGADAQPYGKAILVDAYLTIGWYDDAARFAEDWLAESPEEAWALVSSSRIARLRGRPQEAEKLARRALARAPGLAAARLELAEALREQGLRRGAAREAEPFLEKVTGLIDRDRRRLREDVSPASLLLLARGCALYGLLTGRSEALKLAVEDLYPEIRRRAPTSVEAYVGPAQVLLAKYNVAEARELYEQALAINPHHPEAHLGLARCHRQAGELKEARGEAEAVLALNPHHPEAHAFLARIDLAEGARKQAKEHVRRALTVNPNLGDAWAVSMLVRVSGEGLPEDVTEQLLSLPAPVQAQVHRELGAWFSDRRRYPEAEVQFQRALLVAPEDPKVLAGLGLTLFRKGEEAGAREMLGKAFALDSFNVRVYNALEVLDFLSELPEQTAGKVVVRAPGDQQLLAGYLAAAGSEAVSRLAARFEVELDEPIVIELMPTGELFGARVTGVPGSDVNGVCLGRVVVVLAPEARDVPFNWHDTLLHELMHAVCHGLAGGKLPQWLEEGLAQWAEGVARPRSWNLVLTHAQSAKGLLSLQHLDRAFLAESGSSERALAYAQSGLAVEFLVGRFGPGKLLALMKQAASSPTWDGAVAAALELAPAELGGEYLRFAEERCLELRARLALADQLTKLHDREGNLPGGVLPTLLEAEPGAFEAGVLRRFAMGNADPELARALLEALYRLERTDPAVALALSDLLLAQGRSEESRQVLWTALGAGLRDPAVHVALASHALLSDAREQAQGEADLTWDLLEAGAGPSEADRRIEVWKELARVYADLGNDERARQAAALSEPLGTDEAVSGE